MKCLIAIALLAVMVTYCSATTTIMVAPSTTAPAGVSQTVNTTAASAAAPSASVTMSPTSEQTTAKPSSGVSALPSVLVMTVAVLVAALK